MVWDNMQLNTEKTKKLNIKHYLISTVVVLLCGLFSLEILARFYVYLAHPCQSYHEEFDTKYLASTKIKSNLPLIILAGDSMMNRGISPELLEHRLREKGITAQVINLAVTGGMQMVTVHLLQFMKQHNITPALVLFDYDVVYTNGNSDYANTALVGGHIVNQLGLSYLGKCVLGNDHSFGGKLLCEIDKHSYFIRYRKLLKYQLFNFFPLVLDNPKFNTQNWGVLRQPNHTTLAGWTPAEIIWDKKKDSLLQKRIDFLHSRGPRNPNYQYSWNSFQRLIDYTQQNKIPLILTWLPQYKSEYNKFFYQFPYTHKWFQQKFKSIESQYQNVFALDLNHLPDDVANFLDYRHLNVYGAVKATEALAENLSKEPFRSLILLAAAKSNAVEKTK